MEASVRAILFYAFLVLVVRIVGRRPGKQITPFEFVLVFFMGGLALSAMVGDESVPYERFHSDSDSRRRSLLYRNGKDQVEMARAPA